MHEGFIAPTCTLHTVLARISKIIDPGKKELLRERNMKSLPDEYEAECIPGLEAFAIDELRSFDGVLPHSLSTSRPGFVRFRFAGNPRVFATLRLTVAMYGVYRFEVPRPKAFLGHQHLTRLVNILRFTIGQWDFQQPSLGIGAAGANSSVLARLKQEIAGLLDVPIDADNKGELYLRLARPADRRGWEALVRLTPRPLSKRDWRELNVPGALNATVAFAMTQIQRQERRGIVLNLCCGSATILIEHALIKDSDLLVAIDNSPLMLDAASRNLRASAVSNFVTLINADAGHTPLRSNSIDRIYADLPFGGYVGSHADNLRLYPAALREAERVSKPDAVCIMLTHEVHLLRKCIAQSNWRAISESKITLSGLHPRLFVLKRKSTRI